MDRLPAGVYYLEDFPVIPQHPQCMCNGAPVTIRTMDAMLAALRGEAGLATEGRPGMGDLDVDAFVKDFVAPIQVEEGLESGPGSASFYLVPDGKGGMMFTPERQALHDEIVRNALAGVPQAAHPDIYMLGGGPAAGKSTILKSGQVDVPDTDEREAVLVNPDEVKVLLPEYQAMQTQGEEQQLRAAPFVHEESSYLAKRIRAAAIEMQKDVVIDGVGVKYNDVIALAKPDGYDIRGYYVMLQDPNVAVERAEARAAKTGRSVPSEYILDKHKEVAQKFPDAAERLDTIVLYDTTVNPPQLVAHKDLGGELVIDNPAAYSRLEVLARGEEPLPMVPRPGMGDLDLNRFTKDFFAETQESTPGPGSTVPHLLPDGKGGYAFTPERQRLHDEIVRSALAGVPMSPEPTLHMLGGGPGAGKTTLLKSGLIKVPDYEAREAVLVNPDEMKVLLPEYQAMQAEGGQVQLDAAPFVHEESSYLAKRVRAAAIENGMDAVLDGVGTNYAEVKGLAEPAGYSVYGHYVFLQDPMVAVERAEARAAHSGRAVPSDYVLSKHQEVAKRFEEAAKTLDAMELYDTGVKPPKLVARKPVGGELEIVDEETYQRLQAVARGEFPKIPREGMGDLDLSRFQKDFFTPTRSGRQGSAVAHLVPDGRGGYVFTEERQKLHDTIVESFLKDVPVSEKPTVYMLGGGPAAGKSTILKSGMVDVPSTDDRQAVLINPDEVRVLLPEYQAMQAEGGEEQVESAPVTHEEASYLAKRIRAAAIETSRDLVIDGVGVNYNDIVSLARPEGYEVHGYYVMVRDPRVAVERAEARAEKTGRSVPADYILAKHKEVAEKFADASEQLDSIVLFDTSVNPPKRIARRVAGGGLIIENRKTYAQFKRIAGGKYS